MEKRVENLKNMYHDSLLYMLNHQLATLFSHSKDKKTKGG